MIIMDPPRIDSEGYVAIPDKPGLGIEINWNVIKRYGKT
jgi:L-alanine-DL-glutamate epimerase-like enolase superfamily enzyme